MDLQKQINNCRLCGDFPKLTEKSIQVGKTRFIIIGESPAKDGWLLSKRAFYNIDGKLQATGKVLQKLLNNINFSIDDIYFTELCKCNIENRKMLAKCSQNCLKFLLAQLENIPCDIIVTMGKFPTQTLLNSKIDKLTDVVGKIFDVKFGKKAFKLVPIYHPSPLNPLGYKGNVEIFEKIKSI